MKLADVLLVAGKELRETLRDRRTLMVMVLVPLVIYPLIGLGTMQLLVRPGMNFVNGYAATVRGLAFHVAGHELHHRRILKERYLSA